MCQALPGTRCQHHANKTVHKAQTAYDAKPTDYNKKKLEHALYELRFTPEHRDALYAKSERLKAAGDLAGGTKLNHEWLWLNGIANTRNALAASGICYGIRGGVPAMERMATSVRLGGDDHNIFPADRTPAARAEVAASTVDAAQIYRFTSERNRQVKLALISNPAVTPEALGKLAGGKDTVVSEAAQAHPAYDASMLPAPRLPGTIKERAAERVERAEDLARVTTDPAEQRELSNNKSQRVRRALADSKFATREVLLVLAAGSNRDVAMHARNNRNIERI